MWSICTDSLTFAAALEGDGLIGVRIMQRTGSHRIWTPLDPHERLVDEIAGEDFVAGVTPIVPKRGIVVVVPQVTERRPMVIAAMQAPQQH